MTLDASQYQDPMLVLMRKESIQEARHKHCGDCIHHQQMQFKEIEHVCDMGRHYGYRCTFYQKDANGKNL